MGWFGLVQSAQTTTQGLASKDILADQIKDLNGGQEVTVSVERLRAVLHLLDSNEKRRSAAETHAAQLAKRLHNATTAPLGSLVDMVDLFLTGGCSRDQLRKAWRIANERIRPDGVPQ